MNVLSRLFATVLKPKFYSAKGIASNPGHLPVQYWRWVKCFPQASLLHRVKIVIGLILLVLGLTVAATFWKYYGLSLAAGGLISVAINVYRMLNGNYRYACEQFQYGCANPGVVVSVNPYLVAVHTDLTKGDGEKWPVVRIDRQPLEKTSGGRFAAGNRVVAVAFYFGNEKLTTRHWVNVTPIVANCVSDDQHALQDLYNTIDTEDWQDMDKYVAMLPRPYTPGLYTPGLYWMRSPDTKPNAPVPYFQKTKPSPKWQ